MAAEYTLEIEAALDRLDDVRQFVERSARGLGAGDPMIPDLVVAVDEAVTNIIVHGYKQRPGMIEVSVGNDADALVVRLRDEAPQFDPCTHRLLDLEASLEKDTPGGFGLHLINKAMDDISYRAPSDGGNELTLVKKNVIPPG